MTNLLASNIDVGIIVFVSILVFILLAFAIFYIWKTSEKRIKIKKEIEAEVAKVKEEQEKDKEFAEDSFKAEIEKTNEGSGESSSDDKITDKEVNDAFDAFVDLKEEPQINEKEELSKRTRVELLEIAKEEGLTGISKLKKEEIIERILNNKKN